MLHNEARALLIKGYDKTHNVRELAECFGVNTSTVYRLLKRRKTAGSIEAQTQFRGRKAILTPEKLEKIRTLVEQRNDITVNEIVAALGLQVCSETVRKALIKLGYVYKKKSMHAKEQERPRCGEKAEGVARSFFWIQPHKSGFSG